MVSGKIPAVMVHVNVGTANTICGVANAVAKCPDPRHRRPDAADGGGASRRARRLYHWGQEMFDQAGMLRELVKWDYELRNGAQIETVVDRALSIAASEPAGPVYLTLPREVLAQGSMPRPISRMSSRAGVLRRPRHARMRAPSPKRRVSTPTPTTR